MAKKEIKKKTQNVSLWVRYLLHSAAEFAAGSFHYCLAANLISINAVHLDDNKQMVYLQRQIAPDARQLTLHQVASAPRLFLNQQPERGNE